MKPNPWHNIQLDNGSGVSRPLTKELMDKMMRDSWDHFDRHVPVYNKFGFYVGEIEVNLQAPLDSCDPDDKPKPDEGDEEDIEC